MQIWFLFSLRTIDQIKCELWRRKMILCYQEVLLLSGCGVGKEAKVRTSFFSWAIFFFNSILSFKHPPPHHYPPPHFLAEKGNWFKNISSALLKVWLQYNVPVGGFQIWDTKTISASCCLRVRFPFVWVCVCVCMSGAILLAKQNLSQPGSSSKVQELCDELSWRGKMQSQLLSE